MDKVYVILLAAGPHLIAVAWLSWWLIRAGFQDRRRAHTAANELPTPAVNRTGKEASSATSDR
jgi:peptidoglycan/LPS O-acetylase OafA/YrhL